MLHEAMWNTQKRHKKQMVALRFLIDKWSKMTFLG
jgi:hypothetical protein